jgi:hypothetical protein
MINILERNQNKGGLQDGGKTKKSMQSAKIFEFRKHWAL